MSKFKKMVAIEPTRLLPEWDEELKKNAEEAIFYTDIPENNDEIIRRIGDADCVMLSYTSTIDNEVLSACKNIRYIGMCCSLYAPENANVDIINANKKGIVVKGVRDYGDEGVREYVVSELVRILHGRGDVMWKEEPMELTGINIGVVGMGTVGSLVTQTLDFLGANMHYYSRTRKPQIEEEYNCTYLPLEELLPKIDIVITCLNKNIILFTSKEFEQLGSGKIFMNVSISPSHETPALKGWLRQPGNYAFGDTVLALGQEIAMLENAYAGNRSAGMTLLAKKRLARKVIDNIEQYFLETKTSESRK